MRILLGCLNLNDVGGSEMYHYELSKELVFIGHEVTLFTLRPINATAEIRQKLNFETEQFKTLTQVDQLTNELIQSHDIIVCSQPEVVSYVLTFDTKDISIVSIIHSEIRSETPITNPRIVHYIAIRPSIQRLLIDTYRIPSSRVSLIYNPIDQRRYNSNSTNVSYKKFSAGIFVGEVLDPIRFNAVNHLVNECISNNWHLYIMSKSRYNFNTSNVKYLDRVWNTETYVSNMDFTAGILLGRTTLEGLSCNVPGYVYLIDIHGNILDIQYYSVSSNQELIHECNSVNVAHKHIDLYKQLITK